MGSKIKLTRTDDSNVSLLCVTDLLSDITTVRPINTPNTGWNNQLLDSSVMSGDIELCYTIGAMIPNTPQMIGLNSDIGINASYATIDYAFYIYDAGATKLLRIYENGAFRGDFPTWNIGDELCIRKTGTLIEYFVNNSLVYTSTIVNNTDLGVDSSYYFANGFWGTGTSVFNNISLCQR